MNVIKRSGKIEPLNIDKIHQVLAWGENGLNNVSISEVELQANLQFTNNMLTSDIHKVLTKTTADLISEKYPNYQYFAARMLLMQNRKEVYGQFDSLPLNTIVQKNIKLGYYEDIYKYFTPAEIDYYDSRINYDRDYTFTYAGLRTVLDKYAVTNKKTEKIYETPQIIFMLVSMIKMKDEKELIIDYYNALSKFKISLPSPIMAGLRTPVKGYSSCCKIDAGDTKDSLIAANAASVVMTTIKAGIGIFGGSIRGLGANVANGTIKHTGNVPILKWFESAVKSFSQGSRGGGATIYYTFWHWEIEKILTLKSNKSTEENSVRKLDYGIGINQLLWDRAEKNENITLFSAEETPELINNLNDYDKWVETYLMYEQKRGIRKKKIKARDIIKSFATEAFETGRYYPLMLDNVNRGPLKSVIKMSNLCSEIMLPVTPMKHLYDPDAEIALCILTNINAGKVEIEEMPAMAKLIVHGLNHIIDMQEYPLPAAENSTKNARYLGIGVSDWAHKLTKSKVRYDTKEALDLSEEYMENWQYNLLKASMELAKKDGEAPWFRTRSKYADGWLPNANRQRFISDSKWTGLSLDIQKYGLRNLTLSAIPPAGTSSDVSNSTSGLDMPRDFVITKKSKAGPMKQVLPNFAKGSSYYNLAFDNLDNKKYLDMISKFQLYTDQGISANIYFSPKNFIDGKMPLATLIGIYKHAHKIGLKSIYYCNFDDQDLVKNDNGMDDGCEGGACSV
ncbi:MAG: ribonucleoside-diphosphate reductase subunit alpha [Clostridiales bacterium]|nr:ribonucleoside-diphosphate reductase subunit alpha [Clostridiales bacterium]